MIATVIGGTGLTGSYLLRDLLADREITEVISVSRKPSGIANRTLKEILIPDLNQIPDVKFTPGGLFFCCLGTTIKTAGSKENFLKVDYEAILAFARAAKAHDAKSFSLVSAMGANARSMFFYNQVKGRTEDDVRALGLRSTLIFRPALLTGPRREYRVAESLAAKTLLPLTRILPEKTQKQIITPAVTLATRMVALGKYAPAGVHAVNAKDI